MAAWLIIIGSVFIVLMAFQQVATLGSIESQEAAEQFISTSPGSGLGLTVDDVQRMLRLLSFIAAGCATAAAILGVQVLKASRSARLVLSFLAPVLLISAIAPAGFSAALVVAAIVMLWVQPSRSWFAGVPAPAPVSRSRSKVSATVGADATTGSSPAAPPPPPTASSWGIPEPGSSPYGGPATAAEGARPRQVTTACVLTIASSATVFVGIALSLVYLLTSRAELIVEIEKELATASYDQVSADAVADVAIGFFVVFLVWALLAIVLAIATLRRSDAARIALVVSSILAALVALLGVLVLLPLAITAAGVIVAVLLLGRDSRAWFASKPKPKH